MTLGVAPTAANHQTEENQVSDSPLEPRVEPSLEEEENQESDRPLEPRVEPSLEDEETLRDNE